MHELSIAHSIVEVATQALKEYEGQEPKVAAVYLELGLLSGVVKDALLFSYELACQDTPLAGSKLLIEEVPVSIYCTPCDAVQVLQGVQRMRCPVCDALSADIRSGRELDVRALELVEMDASSES